MTLAHLLAGRPDAPVLVLPSSLGTTRELWDAQIDALERDFRVLRYEHRGHGASPEPQGPYSMPELGADAIALLDELGIERALWCGLSLGGMVGMWLAVHAPERLSGLVLACTSAHVASPDAYRERAALVREHGIEPVADAIVARWFTSTTFHERPDLPERFRAIVVSQPVEGYAGCCEALAGWDFREELASIAVPTLVVLDGAAHLANLEQPDAFLDAVLPHLQEHA